MKPSGLYVLQTFDIFQRNKKSERRPHQNEVRISQVWWTIQDSNSDLTIHRNFFNQNLCYSVQNKDYLVSVSPVVFLVLKL